MYTTVQLEKPFNPLLGETFQSYFLDGTRVYCEMISHHPPIGNFLMEDPEELYTFYGHYEFKAKVTSNALNLRTDGPNHLVFPDGQHITFIVPNKKVGGMVWGDRTVVHDESYTIEDKKNGWKCVVLHDSKKPDVIHGKLYHYKPELNLQKKEPQKLSEIKDIQQEICTVSGSYLERLVIGDKEYWHIDKVKPMKPIPVANPLPSDPRYRDDLIWMFRGHQEYASIWKSHLENQQRHERKLRAESDKAHGREPAFHHH